MLRRILCLVLPVGLTAALAVSYGLADDKKDTKKEDTKKDAKAPEITPMAKAVQDMHMAFQLAQYGREHKTPEALILAARVIGSTPLGKSDEKLPADVKPYDQHKEADDLIAEALKLPDVNAEIQKLATDTRKAIGERPKGATNGPKVYEGYLQPGDSREYQIRFAIGQLATISVRNLRGVDMDLSAVCNRSGWNTGDRGYGDPYVSFTVGTVSTDGFTVRVANYGSQGGRFVLITN